MNIKTSIPTSTGKKSIEEILDNLNYSSYKVQRNEGMEHDVLVRWDIGNEKFKERYEKEKS